jgi:hypothetical protein
MNVCEARELRRHVQTQSEADRRRDPRSPALARRPLAATLLDRVAIERFLERAAQLLPAGDVETKIALDDAARNATFPTLRDLAADPDLDSRLSNVAIALVRRENGVSTHELHLANDDGRATLSAFGEYVWANGAVAILAELLAVYAKRQTARALAPVAPLNFFSAGATLATTLAAGLHRGGPAAVAAALACGAVWFLLDMALSELRLALTPRPPPPFAIEIRSQRPAPDPFGKPVRVWFALRFVALLLWVFVILFVFTVVVPHVPKVW